MPHPVPSAAARPQEQVSSLQIKKNLVHIEGAAGWAVCAPVLAYTAAIQGHTASSFPIKTGLLECRMGTAKGKKKRKGKPSRGPGMSERTLHFGKMQSTGVTRCSAGCTWTFVRQPGTKACCLVPTICCEAAWDKSLLWHSGPKLAISCTTGARMHALTQTCVKDNLSEPYAIAYLTMRQLNDFLDPRPRPSPQGPQITISVKCPTPTVGQLSPGAAS
eukprot:1161975-Pelagomonas_calceolata.AAC.6